MSMHMEMALGKVNLPANGAFFKAVNCHLNIADPICQRYPAGRLSLFQEDFIALFRVSVKVFGATRRGYQRRVPVPLLFLFI